jgi:hypothetical protein
VKATDSIAIYAAVVATATFAWQVWLRHQTRRPQLDISLEPYWRSSRDWDTKIYVTNLGERPSRLRWVRLENVFTDRKWFRTRFTIFGNYMVDDSELPPALEPGSTFEARVDARNATGIDSDVPVRAAVRVPPNRLFVSKIYRLKEDSRGVFNIFDELIAMKEQPTKTIKDQAEAATQQVQQGHQQPGQAYQAQQLSGILPLYQTHWASDMSQARQFISDHEPGPIDISTIDPKRKLELRGYINHLNFVAILVTKNIIDRDTARVIFEDAATRCLNACAPLIEEIDKTEDREYASALKDLVNKGWRS